MKTQVVFGSTDTSWYISLSFFISNQQQPFVFVSTYPHTSTSVFSFRIYFFVLSAVYSLRGHAFSTADSWKWEDVLCRSLSFFYKPILDVFYLQVDFFPVCCLLWSLETPGILTLEVALYGEVMKCSFNVFSISLRASVCPYFSFTRALT